MLLELRSQKDNSNAIIEDSLAKLTKLNPTPFGSKDAIKYITPANYEDNLDPFGRL